MVLSPLRLYKVVKVASDPRAWKALTTWPCFSLTAYRMVTSLRHQGVRPATVIDIGANVGQFTVAAAKLLDGPTIHAFEPLPSCFEMLTRNTARLSNIVLHQLAIGDNDGSITFHRNVYSHASSVRSLSKTHANAFPDAQEAETIQVTMSTLDSALGGTKLAEPVMLKIDVQGYEAQVLAGAQEVLKRVSFALVETSFRPLYEGEALFRQILTVMERHGMSFARPIDFLAAPSGEILQMDALFVRGT